MQIEIDGPFDGLVPHPLPNV